MPELKDWWSEVSPLLDEAMELPLAARESWLAISSGVHRSWPHTSGRACERSRS
jgi:hypothetical protein